MKISCHREGLLAACQIVNVAVPSRDILPVLRNIKIVADDDKCTLMATDAEVGIHMEVRSVKVMEPGEALFPASRIIAILREATDDEIAIDTDADSSVLRGQRVEFAIPVEDPSHFPDFPTFDGDTYHEISAGVLREMIRRTQFAVVANPNEARWGATTGILWELINDQVRLVTTDGKRMAVTNGQGTQHGGQSTENQMPVAPAKAMTLLERNLQLAEKSAGDVDELVRVAVRQNEILFKTDRSTIYSRLVEGRFPTYQQIIPSNHPIKLQLVVKKFLTAIRQAAIMTSDESRGVTFNFSEDLLTMQAKGSNTGTSRVEMEITYQHPPMEISFDPRYLTDMLRVLEPDATVHLDMKDSKSPILLRNEAGDYFYVVVPIVARDDKSKTNPNPS